MKRLVLHIGAHKTGSTSIQDTLFKNRVLLDQNGIFYASTSAAQPNIHHFIKFSRHRDFENGFILHEGEELLSLLTSSAHQTVIASTENLFFIFNQDEIQKIADLVTPHFDEVKIVGYLRRQDRHTVSHHQEGAKPIRPAEETLWGNSPRALPDANKYQRMYLDYHSRIAMWKSCFGSDAMVLKVFDRALLKNEDVVQDFAEVVGISHAVKTYSSSENISLGFEQAKLGHLANSLELPNYLKFRILDGVSRTSRKLLPSRAEAMALYSEYRDGNKLLNEEYSISDEPYLFNDDFSDYPEEPAQEWTEDTATHAIEGLFEILLAMESEKSSLLVDDLRDAALRLTEIDPQLAYRLIKRAYALRPRGGMIKKRYEQLKQVIEDPEGHIE